VVLVRDRVPRAGEEPVVAGAAGQLVGGAVVEDGGGVEPGPQFGDARDVVVGRSPLGHDGTQGRVVGIEGSGAADEDVVAAAGHDAIGPVAADKQVAALAADQE